VDQDDIRTRAVLAIERAMPETDRQAILDRFRHSVLNGAAVADILDILDNHDFLLEYREPFYEDGHDHQVWAILQVPTVAYPEVMPPIQLRIMSYAVMARALLEQAVPNPQNVATLVRTAMYGMQDRSIAWTRSPYDACQASTPGCCIDHSRDHGSCETW
jgi:hypothetical protein